MPRLRRVSSARAASRQISRRRARGLLAAALIGATAAGCSESPQLPPGAARGRAIYQGQCGVCHHPSDPSQPGPVGPPIAAVPRAVLEAKVLRGAYPEGYTPKRTSRLMPPMPQLAADLDVVAEYLGAR